MTASRSNASSYAHTGLRFLFVGIFAVLPLAILVCNVQERAPYVDQHLY